MSLKDNVIKGWILTILGIATIILALFLVFNGVFDFWPEGIAGLIVGTILVISPKDIIKIILEGLRSWGNKKDDSSEPPFPNNPPL